MTICDRYNTEVTIRNDRKRFKKTMLLLNTLVRFSTIMGSIGSYRTPRDTEVIVFERTDERYLKILRLFMISKRSKSLSLK